MSTLRNAAFNILAVPVVYLLCIDPLYAQAIGRKNTIMEQYFFRDFFVFLIILAIIVTLTIYNLMNYGKSNAQPDQVKEISLWRFVGKGVSSPAGLPGLAALTALMLFFLPYAIFEILPISRAGFPGYIAILTGYQYVGWLLFLPFLAFAIATATRVQENLAHYRKLADQVAFIVWALVLVLGFSVGFKEDELWKAFELVNAFIDKGLEHKTWPYFGTFLTFVPPVLLLIARFKEKRQVKLT